MSAKKKSSHHHAWKAFIRFKCECGASHVDPIAIGIDGQVFITRTGCVTSPRRDRRNR